jgi:hypothetical protein
MAVNQKTLNFLYGAGIIILIAVAGYILVIDKNSAQNGYGSTIQTPAPTQSSGQTSQAGQYQTIQYQNTEYGFKFLLPASWSGYSILTDIWQGSTNNGSAGDQIIEEGPMISIRHPQWTSQNPRQDIPIMILTLSQWDSLQQEKFHVSAAPIPPSELGRNSNYVFALPARYNYAFATGYEEVENILQNHPLSAF